MLKASAEPFRRSIGALETLITSSTDVDGALDAAQLYGRLLWNNACGVYEADELERVLTSRVVPACSDLDIAGSDPSEQVVSLIASTLYESGGHTPIVSAWLRLMSDECPHRLIVTRSIPAGVASEVSRSSATLHRCFSRGVKGVREVLQAASGSSTVVLHIHPDDIIAAVAARILRSAGVRCVFFNHADHVFSFGLPGADVVCEVSKYGIELNRRSGRVRASSRVLGIPISVDGALTERSGTDSGEGRSPVGAKTIVSCGSGYKYKPGDQLSFPSFIDSCLATRSDVRVVLVGPNGSEPWWRESREQWGGRISFMGQLAANEYRKVLATADVYVDSFPITGGTAFPQALLAGVPVVGIDVPLQGYSCVDKLRVSCCAELVDRVNAILDGDVKILDHIRQVRELTAVFHSESHFRNRILRLYDRDASDLDSDDDWADEIRVDTSYLEREWIRGGRVKIPYNRIRALPMSFRIKVAKALLPSLWYRDFRSASKLISHAVGWS